jgi:TIR- and PNP-associating SLOG family/Transcriptional regulatory protein, C terminal
MPFESSIYGPFRLDLASGQLFRLDVPIGELLTDTERKLLSVIMSFKGDVATYEAFERDADTVAWYVNSIRKKLGSSSSPFRHIQNVWGVGYRFELQTRDLSGRRVHIAGSAGESDNLEYAHRLTRALVSEIMRLGGGFVVSAGGDPRVGAEGHNGYQIFDWTVLETALTLLSTTQWLGAGKRIVNIHADDIADSRISLWRSLLQSGDVEHFILPQNPRNGDAVEEAQTRFGDILIAMGGRLGVQMLAKRYRLQRKHVVPLDIDISSKSGYKFVAAQILRMQALQEHCEGWFSLREDCLQSPVALLELTGTNGRAMEIEEVCSGIVQLLLNLDPPYCVVIFPPVAVAPQSAMWCELVAAPVLRQFGFRVVCAEASTVSIELFRAAAWTVIDLTGLDPHCLLQAGAVLGAAVNFIWTAREDTPVPFPSRRIFRWAQPTGEIQGNADRFREYLTTYFSSRLAET